MEGEQGDLHSRARRGDGEVIGGGDKGKVGAETATERPPGLPPGVSCKCLLREKTPFNCIVIFQSFRKY